jgi:hypothetical protein
VTRLLISTIAAALLLASCAHTATEPVIVTQTLKVPVPTPCVPATLGPAPTYPDTDDALRAADSERFWQLVLAGRDVRIARLSELETTVTGCPRK